MWVRGLKLGFQFAVHLAFGVSHPVWVRGLKQISEVTSTSDTLSHPVWVRGLKRVDSHWSDINEEVAPRVGAWIETQK